MVNRLGEMLANLREKLLNVNLFSTTEESSTVIKDKINLNAGANILQHFQNQWEELHKLNEENAKSAENTAVMIDEISQKIKTTKENVKLLTNLVSNSNLTENISSCLKAVKTLYETASNVEDGIVQLQQLIDEVEYQNLKSQHQYHLAQYKKRKEESFEKMEASAKLEHSKKIEEYEVKKKKILEERQKVFQDAFKSDLEAYKNLGTIPKNSEINKGNAAILEEIELDFDHNELDQFFNE